MLLFEKKYDFFQEAVILFESLLFQLFERSYIDEKAYYVWVTSLERLFYFLTTNQCLKSKVDEDTE